MTDDQDGDPATPLTPIPELSDEELRFIRDEGLDLLTAFKAILDRQKRDLILELARTIAEAEPPGNGKCGNGT